MEETFKLVDIKETGYDNWNDFYFNLKSYGSYNDQHSFEFYAPSNKAVKTIQLKISQKMLQALVLEEAKKLLQFINVQTFKELLENHNRDLSGNRKLEFDVIIKEEGGEIYARKIIFDRERVERLIDLEQMNISYLIYHVNKK